MMHPSMMAREANEIVAILDRMKWMDDQHVPIHLEDVRARLDGMGFTLEDVVRAGVYRLGRVTAKIGHWAEVAYRAPVYLTTNNWRDEIQLALEWHEESLDWKHRTFLKCLLTKDELAPHELNYANSLMEGISCIITEDRKEEAACEPPPYNQQMALSF